MAKDNTMPLIRLEIKDGNEPIATVPEIESMDLISDDTLDRILADINDGSYTGIRMDNGAYLGNDSADGNNRNEMEA